MALTPIIRNTDSGSLVVSNTTAPEVRVYEGGALALIAFPTPEIYNSEIGSLVAVNSTSTTTDVSDAGVLVIARGRIDNPRLTAWSYTLDGHDFYVLRIGSAKTLIYDISTGQWSWFSSNGLSIWRPNVGFNWRTAGANAAGYGSNVVVGDDTYGLLWLLSPELGVDNNPLSGFADTTFERVATGQMVVRGRVFEQVYSAYLTGSLGTPSLTVNSLTLEYSDDLGQTYASADQPITVVAGDYNQELSWRSLGVVKAPGRLFRLTDNGSLARIDSLNINE